MRTKSKANISKAEALFACIQKRLELEKEEAELKDYFKALSCPILEAGDVTILIETKSRESLDKDALRSLLGHEIDKYTRTTQYSQVTVRKAS